MIIDVRSKTEFEQEHIKDALWLDVEKIAAGEVPNAPKDEEIILYCRSGARSSVAAHLLQAKGFVNATSAGGLNQMAVAGYTVVR